MSYLILIIFLYLAYYFVNQNNSNKPIKKQKNKKQQIVYFYETNVAYSGIKANTTEKTIPLNENKTTLTTKNNNI